MVTLSDGTSYVFFHNGDEPAVVNPYLTTPDPSADVYVQRYSQDGLPISAPEIVNTTTFHGQYHPDVLTFSDGSFVVVWSQTQTGSSFAVVYQRYNADGTKLG